MNDLRLLELAAHVVTWHNRHPLARRIRAEHVHSMGYVVLPFVGPVDAAAIGPASAPPHGAADAAGEAAAPASAPAAPGDTPDSPATTSLRERAMARAQQGPGAAPLPSSPGATPSAPGAPPAPSGRALKRGFDEDFIAPLSPRSVARWVARHGVAMAPPRQDAPVRRIAADTRHDAARLTDRWVLTAQVQTGNARTRVLVGPGGSPALLGQRLLSPARVAVLAVMVGAMVATLAALQTGGLGAGSASPAAPAAPAAASSSASAPASTSTSAPASSPASSPASAPTSAPASAPASAASAASAVAAAVANAPVDVEPTLGRIDLPSLGRVIDERRRNQTRASQQAASAAATAATAATTTTAAAAADTATATPAPLLQGPAFAVSTRLLRTRSEGEQVAEAMRALLVPPGSTQMQVDLLPAGADWRVVGWPYTSRAQAAKARAMLAARGMRVEIIDF